MILWLCSTASCARQSCPKSPAVQPANPPATIAVQPAPVPCNLPPLPEPVQIVGMAAPDGIYVTKADVAALVGYLVGVRGWISAAAACMEAR